MPENTSDFLSQSVSVCNKSFTEFSDELPVGPELLLFLVLVGLRLIHVSDSGSFVSAFHISHVYHLHLFETEGINPYGNTAKGIPSGMPFFCSGASAALLLQAAVWQEFGPRSMYA